MNPPIGYDLDSATVEKILDFLSGKYVAVDPREESQLRELAFWRWVAYEGYAGKSPELFREHQKEWMLGCYEKTGWAMDRFHAGTVYELGCGPLGMIEFVPGNRRFAYDPLNAEYAKLFAKLRSNDVRYITSKTEIDAIPLVDLGICFNVLDHTENAREWFLLFFDRIKNGGAYLLQVNTVRNGLGRSDEHQKMHPSPLVVETVLVWLNEVSSDYNYLLSDTPSDDNEFFFMAWGSKMDNASPKKLRRSKMEAGVPE